MLVSGASGFIACHAIQQLLQAGYKVRGTVRSLKNEAKVQPIRDLCPEKSHNLELVEANLLDEECWKNAVKDCDYVLHLASPFPAENPAHEDELVKPAVNGTLNVLKACAMEKSVKRVVLTSSCASIYMGYGNEQKNKVFTEADWSIVNNKEAYVKSKTLAEKAAWDFQKNLTDDQNKFELATINPSVVLGPMLHKTESTTVKMIKQLMQKEIPMVAKICLGCCDVRDVAKAHILAMEKPEAAGKRFITNEKCLWLKEIAQVLAKEFGPLGYNVPLKVAPYPILWLGSFFDKTTDMMLPYAGQELKLDNTRIRTVLGLEMIPVEKSIIDMGHSLIEKGIVNPPKKSC